MKMLFALYRTVAGFVVFMALLVFSAPSFAQQCGSLEITGWDSYGRPIYSRIMCGPVAPPIYNGYYNGWEQGWRRSRNYFPPPVYVAPSQQFWPSQNHNYYPPPTNPYGRYHRGGHGW